MAPKKQEQLPSSQGRPLTDAELPESSRLPASVNPLAEGVFMAHQREWLEDASPLKICEKGRRTGITFAQAWEDTLVAAAAASAGGMNCFYIGDTKAKGLEYLGYVKHYTSCIGEQLLSLDEYLFEDRREDGTTKFITAYRARFASGFRVEALSGKPENIRGLQGQVTIDEAAFHANVKDVIAAVNALLIWGGRIRLISSHNGAVNPFNVLILEARAGKSPFVVHRYTFDDAIDGGLYERVCAKQGKAVTEEGKAEWYRLIIDSYGTDDEARQQELHCIPAQGSGAFLSLVLIEARMREGYELVSWRAPSGMVDWEKAKRRDTALEFCETLMPHLKALPQDLDHYLGEDFGRHADRTDIAPCFLAKDLVRHFPLVVELASVPFDAQALILWYIIDRLPRFRHGILDANGNGMALAEAARQKYGASRITELKPSEQFYLATMPLFKSAFEQDGIMVPRHADIRDDLGMLRLVNGVAKVPAGKRRTGSDGEARHGDSGMSLVYGYAASLVSTVPVEFQGLGQLRDTGSLRDYIDGGAGGASRHGADLSDFMSLGG